MYEVIKLNRENGREQKAAGNRSSVIAARVACSMCGGRQAGPGACRRRTEP